MATTKADKIRIRNERIKADFKRLTSAPHFKSADHVVEVILADKYLPLEASTIWRIVNDHKIYKKYA